MSRVGLSPITIPEGVQVDIQRNLVTVKGKKGELSHQLPPSMSVSMEDGTLVVKRPSDEREQRSLHGLTRSLIANMVHGVSSGFERVLEINGVGYRAQKANDRLSLQVGYSRPVDFPIPPGIDVAVEANRVRVSGIDKETVGQTAARIRAVRPVDHYKGKGIKYAEERVRLKPGKSGKVSKG